MTTPDELDRVISHVAAELTRANTAGFGERVQGRLCAHASASQGRLRGRASASQARIAWWSLAAVTAAVAIVAVVTISRREPHPPTGASIAAAPAPVPAVSIATAMAPSSDVARPASPRAAIARAGRSASRAISPAELAWLARAVPPLADAAPLEVPGFGMTSIAPRGVDLPALVIEPLGPPDINK